MRKTMGLKKLLVVLIMAVALSGYFYWQNNGLTVTRYHHSDPAIPAGFSGFSILQVSDLHNKSFGKNQEVLLESVEALAPDGMTTMYVSRGLGNSIFPFRVHNRPELVMVTLNQN